ncbi:MAG: carbamoyltransferase HypF [Planctomycetota bacterium]
MSNSKLEDELVAQRLALTVRGIVQGVGFRPFVYNAATSAGLAGWVVNQSDVVRIEVEGCDKALTGFVDVLRSHHPPQALIEELDIQPIQCRGSAAELAPTFEIRASSEGTGTGHRATIPADLATCAACRQEITSAGARRHRYPFTNCTNCGPRWSIITGVPYDRARTSMHLFPMCSACRREYENPADRRFHAQPIACPECGPVLRLVDTKGNRQAVGEDALRAAAAAIRDGKIVAVKGLGGFQLIVDATSPTAVAQLRRRKRRPDKPLAVMLADGQVAQAYCHVSPFEQTQLNSPQAPILLLRKRESMPSSLPIADSVASGNPYLGVMLPYTPLHALLMTEVARPIVCTSGNRSEEPMVIDTSQAFTRLGDIADLILTHDRPIVRPVDDSVCREEQGSLQVLRRARGYAPMPVSLAAPAPCVLAVGGHLKNTVALSMGKDVIISSHVGDLDNTLGLAVHRAAITDLIGFFDAQPEAIVCDLHPDYSSTRHAEQLANSRNIPLIRVQHHHAHVLSTMAEHGLNGPVLGLAWDGTGYGSDGTIWGGEALLVDDRDWTRVAHLHPFSLPGGDRAAREPRRSALGVLYGISERLSHEIARRWFSESELSGLLTALRRSRIFPRTSSMGRLFDAVAALCGLPPTISFEGQAAMQLEFAADEKETSSYEIALSDGSPAAADWHQLILRVIDDRARGLPIGTIAARFHNSLADLALRVACHVGCPRVVLSGGCFQNRLLTRRTRTRLSDAGFDVYTQKVVPPGDGGISLGQILAAIQQLRE